LDAASVRGGLQLGDVPALLIHDVLRTQSACPLLDAAVQVSSRHVQEYVVNGLGL